MLVYYVCKVGDSLGRWLITVLSSISNNTQNILVSIMCAGYLVAQSEANFVALGRSQSC